MFTITADTVVDFSGSTGSVFKFKAPRAGRLNVHESFLIFEELVGDATTQGVMSLEVGGVEVATYTTLGDGTEAVDASGNFTVDGTVATAKDPHVAIAAGDVIDVKLKTQASGGTTTGTARAFLSLDFAPKQA